MKRFILFLAPVLLLLSATPVPVQAQTAQDPNSGFKFERDHVNSIWRIKWWAKSGRIYFIQHSEDLQQWFWFPVVEAGDDSIKEWGFTSNAAKSFFRLIHTEATTEDPEGEDSDGDGISNLVEVQQGSDPLNYYSQGGTTITPVISIVSGNNQALSPGGFSGPLTVKVTNGISGPALPNAPVTFSVVGGSEALAQSPTEVAEFFSTLTLRTDPLTGEISNPQDKIHVRLPPAPSSSVQINAAAAGSLSGFVGLPVQFTVYNYNPFVPPAAPTGLAITANEDGSLTYTWQDNSDSETGFTVEYQLSDGSWAALGSVGPNATSLTVSAVTVVGLGLTSASNTRALAINGAGPSGSGDSEPKLRTWRASFEFHLDDDYGATYIFLAKSLATLRDEWQLYQPPAYVAAHDAFVNDLPNLDYGPSSGGPGWVDAVSSGSMLVADVFTYRHYGELSPYYGCQDTSGSWNAYQVATSQPVEAAYSASYIILKNKSVEFEEPAFEALGTARFDIPAGETLANLTLEGVEESTDIHGDEHTLYLEPEPKYNLNNYNEWISRNGYWLLPIDINFEKVGDNREITDNKNPVTGEWMPGKGKRIFPEAKTPSDQTTRAKVLVKVKTGAPAGWKVRLKAFDVDDPTTADPDHIIDPNDEGGEKGDDNRKRFVPFRPAVFTYSSTETVDCTIDAQGVAKVNGQLPELIIPNQPGDNIRVAAIFLKPNGDPMDGQNINILQAGDKTQPGYVPSGDAPPSGFSGGISPMLTTWRTLHIEVDQMQMWNGNKPLPDRVTAHGQSWEADNPSLPRTYSTLTLSTELPGAVNFYLGGRIVSGNTTLEILFNTTTTITVKHPNLSAPLTQAQKDAFLGGPFEVFDDDGGGLANYAPRLPRPNVINDQVKRQYAPAYIEITEVDSILNPAGILPFDINNSVYNPLTALDDAQDMTGEDRLEYWYHLLVIAYQSGTDNDNDPDGEGALQGATVKPSVLYNSYSVVYIEVIRDMMSSRIGELNFDEIVQAQFEIVVAHEIGHPPGGQSELADHAEEGTMQAEPSASDEFSLKTLKRFRSALRWH